MADPELDKIQGPEGKLGTDADAKAESDQLEVERAAHEHQQQLFQRELGIIGRFIGGKQEKAGNISFIVLLFCFLGLTVLWISEIAVDIYCAKNNIASPVMPVDKVVTALASIITLILGYLFGSNQKSA